jgi:hypothetical protein
MKKMKYFEYNAWTIKKYWLVMFYSKWIDSIVSECFTVSGESLPFATESLNEAPEEFEELS